MTTTEVPQFEEAHAQTLVNLVEYLKQRVAAGTYDSRSAATVLAITAVLGEVARLRGVEAECAQLRARAGERAGGARVNVDLGTLGEHFAHMSDRLMKYVRDEALAEGERMGAARVVELIFREAPKIPDALDGHYTLTEGQLRGFAERF